MIPIYCFNVDYTTVFVNCRFRVRSIPSESKFSVDANIKVCFDATSITCQTNVSVLQDSDLLYTDCSSNEESAPFKGKFIQAMCFRIKPDHVQTLKNKRNL